MITKLNGTYYRNTLLPKKRYGHKIEHTISRKLITFILGSFLNARTEQTQTRKVQKEQISKNEDNIAKSCRIGHMYKKKKA